MSTTWLSAFSNVTNFWTRRIGRSFRDAPARPATATEHRQPESSMPVLAALASIFLILLFQLRHDGRIGQRCRVAEGLALVDVFQETTHDLSRAGLGKVGGKQDLF